MIRTRLLASACLLLVINPAHAQEVPDNSDPAAFDRAALMVEVSRSGFAQAEERHLASAASGDVHDVIRLAHFYMANELWTEALARIIDIDTKEARLLAAECDYRMGRYRSVVARLAQIQPADALAAISLAKLGAFVEARAAFETGEAPAASRNLAAEYQLAKAEALAATGDAAKAAEILSGLTARNKSEDNARYFLIGKIRSLRGDRLGAAGSFRRAAANGADEWSMRARLELAIAANDVTAVDALSIEWRGGAFERDLQYALGRMRLAGDDFDRGFAALGQVVDRYPESQAAEAAQDLVAATLPRLFADDAALHPKDAARLFFENVEFAPPGREGDALIHEAAGKLEALGLYRQAAQLLAHQVFKRLRGVERAKVAAELGELYLLAGNPADALKSIRSTRIAGLEADAAQHRRLIEAKALSSTGKTEDAIVLLSQSPGAEELLLRAEINWSRRAWPDAARDYASYVAALSSLGAKADRAAAVRAATAYLLAGDRSGYRAFAMEAVNRLEGAPEAELIRSLGDVDQGQFLANVMDSYRAVYADARS